MASNILDFAQRKKAIIERKRRQFERVLFEDFVGVYSKIYQGGGEYPVQMVDISPTGCLFRVAENPIKKISGLFKPDRSIMLHIYFTRHSYIPALANIKWTKSIVGTDALPYRDCGCEFDKSTHAFDALSSFIDFIYKFAEHSCHGQREHKIYSI